ncbi:hypothetical protein D3C76_18030 [compost metagenome]
MRLQPQPTRSENWMITIALTKKLFEFSAFAEEQDNEIEDELYKWNANVFRMSKRNNVIFMNN